MRPKMNHKFRTNQQVKHDRFTRSTQILNKQSIS